jgi:hypothetical protein
MKGLKVAKYSIVKTVTYDLEAVIYSDLSEDELKQSLKHDDSDVEYEQIEGNDVQFYLDLLEDDE